MRGERRALLVQVPDDTLSTDGRTVFPGAGTQASGALPEGSQQILISLLLTVGRFDVRIGRVGMLRRALLSLAPVLRTEVEIRSPNDGGATFAEVVDVENRLTSTGPAPVLWSSITVAFAGLQ